MALMLSPCRLSSSISCTSFPLNRSAPPHRNCANSKNHSVKGWGILNRHFGDFYTGRDSFESKAVSPALRPGRLVGIRWALAHRCAYDSHASNARPRLMKEKRTWAEQLDSNRD